jgi:5-methylcytosine-specific restriction endonuclease McrA
LKKHTKIYCDYFGILENDYVACEYCHAQRMTDVHHITPRGMGGKNPRVDVISNLIGLCRDCHNLAEAKKISKEDLKRQHQLKFN